MTIYLAILLPIFTPIVLLIFFRKRLVWWEVFIPFAVCVPLIFICKFTIETALTNDTEYWGSLVSQVEYYEAWDEEVACSHTKYCTRNNSDGTQSSYPCGTEHSYDIDNHPAYWQMVTDCEESFDITENYYNFLSKQFGNKYFVDLHRDYHSVDGDVYISVWKHNEAVARPVVTTHTYENRVQASVNVVNFPAVSDSDKAFYHLFDYPKIDNFACPAILGGNFPEADKKLRFLNGYLGKRKQLRIWMLIFKNQPRQAGLMQEALWKGGNKNEFVVTLNIDDTNKINWCYPFTWSEIPIKADVRAFFEQQSDSLTMLDRVTWLGAKLEKDFVRKQFKDFSYLSVEPPLWALITTFILTFLTCVAVGLWTVKNDFN